jgi:hypothetical protein
MKNTLTTTDVITIMRVLQRIDEQAIRAHREGRYDDWSSLNILYGGLRYQSVGHFYGELGGVA